MEKEKGTAQNQTRGAGALNKNTVLWLWKFTEGKRGNYLRSILLALCGVACMLLTYICLSAVIRELIAGNRDMDFYIQRGVQIGLLWVLRYAFHAFSTATSHVATFGLISNGRRMLLKNLILCRLVRYRNVLRGSIKT